MDNSAEAAKEMPPLPPVPQTVGGLYHLNEEIGRGAYAVVYRCTNALTGREVAIKAISKQFSLKTDRERNRLLSEVTNHKGLFKVTSSYDTISSTSSSEQHNTISSSMSTFDKEISIDQDECSNDDYSIRGQIKEAKSLQAFEQKAQLFDNKIPSHTKWLFEQSTPSHTDEVEDDNNDGQQLLTFENVEKEPEMTTNQQKENFTENIGHPFIAELYETFEDDDYYYIILEYCPNGTLTSLVSKFARVVKSSSSGSTINTTNMMSLILQEDTNDTDVKDDKEDEIGGIPEDAARLIFAQVLSAVEYIHKNHILHRDLKPDNILIAADYTTRICDFGFALKLIEEDGDEGKTTMNYYSKYDRNYIMGSPSFLSPELLDAASYTHTNDNIDGGNEKAKPDQVLTEKADIWSLGVILFFMVTGDLPFCEAELQDLIASICNMKPIIPNYVSKDLTDLIFKMLTKDQSKRIAIDEIKRHPWMTSLNSQMSTANIFDEIEENETAKFKISESIMDDLTIIFEKFDREKLIKDICTNTTSKEAAVYLQILRSQNYRPDFKNTIYALLNNINSNNSDDSNSTSSFSSMSFQTITNRPHGGVMMSNSLTRDHNSSRRRRFTVKSNKAAPNLSDFLLSNNITSNHSPGSQPKQPFPLGVQGAQSIQSLQSLQSLPNGGRNSGIIPKQHNNPQPPPQFAQVPRAQPQGTGPALGTVGRARTNSFLVCDKTKSPINNILPPGKAALFGGTGVRVSSTKKPMRNIPNGIC